MSYGNGEKRTIIFLEAALAEERKQNDHTMVMAGKIAAEMQMEVTRLMAENERLREALEDTVTRINRASRLASAALKGEPGLVSRASQESTKSVPDTQAR